MLAQSAQGIRHDDLRRRNRALVIAAVRRMRQPSRTEIAAATHLSPSTISAIAADLIAENVLREAAAGDGTAKRGRPQIGVELNPGAAQVLALTLALNHLSGAVIDYAGGLVREATLELSTLDAGRDALTRHLAALAGRLVSPERGPVLRAVLAVQGVTDRAARKMLWSPITPWTDLPLADLLEGETGVSAAVENDCSMIAAALHAREPGRFGADFMTVLLSHGIGMGLMLNNALFSGTRSSGAEFGHMIVFPGGALCRCGKRGCVEAYAGDYAIRRRALGMSEDQLPAAGVGPGEMAALAAQARAGNPSAAEAFRRAGEALGFALGSLFALIDPAPVAFVGSGAAAFDLIEPALRTALDATAGGAHAGGFRFSAEEDEMPLIRAGCAVRALDAVDAEIFAARPPALVLGEQMA